MEARISKTISRLGIFQPDKGSSTLSQEAASYLKRQFRQSGSHGHLVERVEYLILSVVHAFKRPDPRFPTLSENLSRLRRSVASSVCSMIRRLYTYSKGNYLSGEKEYILEFLEYVYRQVDLPRGGELRGMLLDLADQSRNVKGAVVFPLDSEYLENDPDLLFSERFTPWVIDIPATTDTTIFSYKGSWLRGETRSCQMNSVLEQLVKYGWLDKRQSSKITLVGPEARSFFRRLIRQEILTLEYDYTANFDFSEDQLTELGVHDIDIHDFFRPLKRRRLHADREYVDLDTISHDYFSELPHRSAKDSLITDDNSALSNTILDY